MSAHENNKNNKPLGGSLAEEAARDAGKNQEEVRSTGAVDRTDDATDSLFDRHQDTTASPVFRAFWGDADIDMFAAHPPSDQSESDLVIDRCVSLTRAHRDAGTLFGADGKLSSQVLQELGAAGYFGARIPKQYGGSGMSLHAFMRMLVRMASEADASTAGLASVHGCIGAVDPLLQFGNEEQKQRFLPLLASGEKLSAFALTEPGAGSDMTNLKVTATRNGDTVLINGRKLFITNAIPGRLISLVTMMDGNPTVFVAELPEAENEQFQLQRYGVQALLHVHNNGLIFKDFPVDARNQLHVPPGADGRENGLLVAYKALNKGRVALCANAAGTAAAVLRSIAPNGWAQYRVTFGQQIQNRELVKGGIARAGSLIVAMNALVDWCSTLLDAGYRGELECIVAKNLGARALKEVALDIATEIHGGRSLLKEHIIGENIAEYIAPSIYEGSKPMLSMAFFLSLVKAFGKAYMAPLNDSLKQLKKGEVSGLGGLTLGGARLAARVTLLEARHAARLAGVSRWRLPQPDATFQRHLDFAYRQFGKLPLTLLSMMIKHQIGLQDRQLAMVRFSARVQDLVAMVVTAVSAAKSDDRCYRLLADLFCRDVRNKLTGRESDETFDRDSATAADMIISGDFALLNGVPGHSVLQPYK